MAGGDHDQDSGVRPDALVLYRHGQAAICDLIEPWAHGVVARASAYPEYWDFNVVRVEGDPGMSVEELTGFADEALAGLAHRQIYFDDASVAEPLRPGFEERGWHAEKLVYMLHRGDRRLAAGDVGVSEVPYEAAEDLRVAWYEEEYPGRDPNGFHEQRREVSMMFAPRVLIAEEDGEPIAFAQIEEADDDAEITEVFVHPRRRGVGIGTEVTLGAIAAAGQVERLWICADDEGRPKELYRRLGFQPVQTTMQFTRRPETV